MIDGLRVPTNIDIAELTRHDYKLFWLCPLFAALVVRLKREGASEGTALRDRDIGVSALHHAVMQQKSRIGLLIGLYSTDSPAVTDDILQGSFVHAVVNTNLKLTSAR